MNSFRFIIKTEGANHLSYQYNTDPYTHTNYNQCIYKQKTKEPTV